MTHIGAVGGVHFVTLVHHRGGLCLQLLKRLGGGGARSRSVELLKALLELLDLNLSGIHAQGVAV